MSIDIIKLGNNPDPIGSEIELKDLASISFQRFQIPTPEMAIWLMTLPPEKKTFPWWSYQGVLDEEIERLARVWSVSNSQHLFDLLFLNQIMRHGGRHFFVIFPGNVKLTGWARLRDEDREMFSKGQGCNYHLEGMYKGKMIINWVPFYQPQSLVKNPRFDSFWRLFLNKHDDQDEANSISFFSMSDTKELPAVVRMLINKDEKRSEKILDYVDWYGLYSSPLNPKVATSCVVYTKKTQCLQNFADLEKQILSQFEQAKVDLLQNTSPGTAIRILNRHLVL